MKANENHWGRSKDFWSADRLRVQRRLARLAREMDNMAHEDMDWLRRDEARAFHKASAKIARMAVRLLK